MAIVTARGSKCNECYEAKQLKNIPGKLTMT